MRLHRWNGVRRSLIGALLAVTFMPAIASADGKTAAPRHIVSLNLCTDELVLQLADSEAIASVTWLSQDPRNSVYFEQARKVKANYGQVEDVLRLKPDLIVAGRYTTRTTVAMLKRLGMNVVDFDVPQSLADMRAQILTMAELLGQRERGEQLVQAIDARLIALQPDMSSKRPSALVLRPNGFTAGKGTLVDDVMTTAGLFNLAPTLKVEAFAQVPLEMVIAADPDVLIVSSSVNEPPSLAHSVLNHPALRKKADSLSMIAIPSRLWTCAGPAALDAVAMLRPVERPSGGQEDDHASRP